MAAAQERNEKSEWKLTQNAEKLGLLLQFALAVFSAWDFLSRLGLPGVALFGAWAFLGLPGVGVLPLPAFRLGCLGCLGFSGCIRVVLGCLSCATWDRGCLGLVLVRGQLRCFGALSELSGFFAAVLVVCVCVCLCV